MNDARILLTCFFATMLGASAISLAASEVALASAKSIETVELRMTVYAGTDGYVEYQVIDSKSSIGTSKVVLRCIERAYDGNIVWSYHELMVLDPKGPEIKRKEPRATVTKENGYSYVFATEDECEKASPTVMDGSAECTMRVAIDRTPIKRKSEKQAKGTAKLISAECVPRAKTK